MLQPQRGFRIQGLGFRPLALGFRLDLVSATARWSRVPIVGVSVCV